MFRALKNSGLVYSRANDGDRGNRGRIELALNRKDGKMTLSFSDVGNYGKNRWDAEVIVTAEDVQQMVDTLSAFLEIADDGCSLPEFVEAKTEDAPKPAKTKGRPKGSKNKTPRKAKVTAEAVETTEAPAETLVASEALAPSETSTEVSA